MDGKELGDMPVGGSLGNYGITLRQHFAGLAMQAMISHQGMPDTTLGFEFLSASSVVAADELLAALSQPATQQGEER